MAPALNSTLTYPNGTTFPITIISSDFNLSDILHNPSVTHADKTVWVFGIVTLIVLLIFLHAIALTILFVGIFHWRSFPLCFHTRKARELGWHIHPWQKGLMEEVLQKLEEEYKACRGHGSVVLEGSTVEGRAMTPCTGEEGATTLTANEGHENNDEARPLRSSHHAEIPYRRGLIIVTEREFVQ
ncbi:MAG: hypothetical protein Q9202_006262 [Teloschistes flavicans]